MNRIIICADCITDIDEQINKPTHYYNLQY